MSMTWGLSGPEQLGGERRTRTLEIGAAVREYNERAVPGMGGVWYAKQLLLAMLGIALAQKLRERKANVSNIDAANAIEALGCYYALKQNKGQGDARVRGAEKLRGEADFDFQTHEFVGYWLMAQHGAGSRRGEMAYWDSYGYPEDNPKVWITFGTQNGGPPSVAFLGPIRQPEGHSPKAVEYYQEVAGRWTDELAAHEELDKIAQALIEQRRL